MINKTDFLNPTRDLSITSPKIEDSLTQIFNEHSSNAIEPRGNQLTSRSITSNQRERIIIERHINRMITFFQEIFISLKSEYSILKEKYPSLSREYQIFPTFNLWLKNYFETPAISSFSFLLTIYLNALSDINELKNDIEINNNKLTKRKLYELEYFFLKLVDLSSQKDFCLGTMQANFSACLELIQSLTFLDDIVKNKFLIIALALNKILNHKKFIQILQEIELLTFKDIYESKSINLKFHVSLPSLNLQLVKNLKLFSDHTNFLINIFNKINEKNIKIKGVVNINDHQGEKVQKDYEFSPLLRFHQLRKEFNKAITLFSNPNIDLEGYLDFMNSIRVINVNFHEFYLLLDTAVFTQSHFLEFFDNNHTLKNYYEGIKIHEKAITNLEIFYYLNSKIELFNLNTLDNYYYGFALLLIKENKLGNLAFISDYFSDVNNMLVKVFHYFQDSPFECKDQCEFFERKICDIDMQIIKYRDEAILNKLSSSNNVFEIYTAIHDILETYRLLEFFIKNLVLTQIKIKMHELNTEKNEIIINNIKKDLNDLTNIYELCLKILNQTHDFFKLYTEDRLVIQENDKTTEEISDDIFEEKKEELFIKEDKLEASSTKHQTELLNDIKKDEKNVLFEKTKKTNKKVNKKKSTVNFKKEKIIEEKSKSYYEEYMDYLEESGWKAHMKRRELLQVLKQNGWKIDASSGKGSHLKAEGPNRTIVIVPHDNILAKGTSKSIEESFVRDKFKDKETNLEKSEKTLLKPKNSLLKKKKNKPKRK